jgi:catechol 2,3-dioxygenase-like lactoylglutathione lyase family enzyme
MSMTEHDRSVDMKLEVVTIPVSDVDRAIAFYKKLGWRQDVTPPGVVQFTPPGSWCSIQFGPGHTAAPPGSAENTYLIVSDIKAAHDQLVAAGIKVDDIQHLGATGLESGPDPEHHSYFSFCTFKDPEGNGYRFQELTRRIPGRVDVGLTSYSSASELAEAMRRASIAHGEHEKRIGAADPDWPDWYASYMAAEQASAPLPE